MAGSEEVPFGCNPVVFGMTVYVGEFLNPAALKNFMKHFHTSTAQRQNTENKYLPKISSYRFGATMAFISQIKLTIAFQIKKNDLKIFRVAEDIAI